MAIGSLPMAGWPAIAAQSLPPATVPVVFTVTYAVADNVMGGARFGRAAPEAPGRPTTAAATASTDRMTTFEGICREILITRLGAKGKLVHAGAPAESPENLPVEDHLVAPHLAMRRNSPILLSRNKGPVRFAATPDRRFVPSGERYDRRGIRQPNRLDVE